MLAPCRHICILIYVADAQLLPSKDVPAGHKGSHACTVTGSRLDAKDKQQGGATTCIIDKGQGAQPEGTGRQGTKAGLKRSAYSAAGHVWYAEVEQHPANPTASP